MGNSNHRVTARAVSNAGQSLCVPRDFNPKPAVKICYRHPALSMPLPQNDSAAGSVGHTLTHRIPVTFNGDRLFRGRTA